MDRLITAAGAALTSIIIAGADWPARAPEARSPIDVSEHPPAVFSDTFSDGPDESGASTGHSQLPTLAVPSTADSPKSNKPPINPYRDPFYNNDFSFLDAPDYLSCDLFDSLKRMEPAPCVTLDVGGEYRMRSHDEDNLRLNGLDNDFLLQRTRLYGDLRYADWLRGYGEFIDATSAFEDLPPRPIEENRADFINLFGDVRLWEGCCGSSLWARVGRHELLYGAQRLISPLDWANTRRTFDGAKLFWKGDSWDVDAFWTRPVPFIQHVPNDHNFDNPDQSREFYGAYATYRGREGHTLDLYYLRFVEDDRLVTGGDGVLGDFDANTFGARWLGRHLDWLCEIEGGYQFGEFANDDQSAGFYVIGLGYDFTCLPCKPTFWAYFDWASGDSDPTDNDRGTFNQLFPLGHKYFGFTDVVARQNIEDVNFLLTLKPHPKATLLLWYHIFELEEARDALYNAAGLPIRSDPTGSSGTDVGNALDIILQIQLNLHSDVLFGYSRFFAGDFVANTGVGEDADFFYTQVSFKF